MKKLTPTEQAARRAMGIFNFVRWADAVAKSDGVPLVGPEQREWIAVAAAELREIIAEAGRNNQEYAEKAKKRRASRK